ncbi:MAG: transposase [Spirochaetia bacterium]|nr:transposase [Spirochaetia bacterium]MCF7941912.1 transposase [Spirochaetia bacterium]
MYVFVVCSLPPEGIIAHETYAISSGKVEGVNNRTKTLLRRQGYGYADDEYVSLKLFDASRKTYVRNPVADRIPQDV